MCIYIYAWDDNTDLFYRTIMRINQLKNVKLLQRKRDYNTYITTSTINK